MNQEVTKLTSRFETANRNVIEAIEQCSDEQLGAFCPAERCTVVALACHMGDVHSLGAGWVRLMLAGDPLPPITMDMVDQMNEEQFALNAKRTGSEALERLRHNGVEASVVLRGLSDADLERKTPFTLFGDRTVSVRQMVEIVLVGDPEGHLPSIKSAAGLV